MCHLMFYKREQLTGVGDSGQGSPRLPWEVAFCVKGLCREQEESLGLAIRSSEPAGQGPGLEGPGATAPAQGLR